LKILITGATGLVGARLLEFLMLKGYDDIRVLTRDKKNALEKIPFPVEVFLWNPKDQYLQPGALDDVEVVIHLAGENIADGRWSDKKKKMILESRVQSSNLLINEIKKHSNPPRKFISSSAVGIYGNRKDEIITCESSLANDYLATVCKTWEESILKNDIPNMKAQCIRTGVVLADSGGALQKMLPAFKAGVAGRIGSGSQYMSWIHLDDLVNQFIFLIENNTQRDVYNGTAPNPVTNIEFTKTLGAVLKRPTILPIPAVALKVLFGEMSEILLNGQRVVPAEFLNEGFKFKYGDLSEAFIDILKFNNSGETILKRYQWIDSPSDLVFDFFSNANNLEKITPPYLGFKVIGKNTPEITTGTKINYRLKIHGIPLTWKSEISVFEKNKTFTDIQLSGPYKKWVHQHDFISCKKGTLIKDKVVYKLPMGFVGNLFAGYFVNKDVKNVFTFRNTIIKNQFK
jgi:uncharacterized protein (TIGR01777 family)